MKEKGDACIFVGYSTQSRAYRVFNKRTRVVVETIHVNFDELPQMVSDHVSSDPIPKCPTTALEHDSLSLGPQCQDNVTQADRIVTTSNELDFLFSPMFDELLNGSSQVVSKSFAVTTTDAHNQRQQQNTTPLNTHSTPDPTCQVLTQAPTVTSTENINQAEMITENARVADDDFIDIFYTPIQNRGETSSHHVDSLNMHTLYQHHPSEHRWTKDHLLEQVIRNPSQSVRTRRQLESDGEMCMFALTVSRTKPKNIKEGMADSAWIESMQEELHQFHRLDIHQSPRGIFINQAKYAQEILIKHGCLDSRKSTSGGIQFLGGDKLVRWLSKKQDCTSMSLVEAEYVSLSVSCVQVLWMRTQLIDYGFHLDKIPMYCDSKAAIAISCNPVQHSRTKHIDVRYHFIKEKVEKGIVELFFVGIEYQLADLFTKAFPEERFKYLVKRLGMRCLTPAELEALTNESA
uniref:Retrovirus-related Pol polyprotein from transposon TNT 1-94 n=1 Tax=Tanacetum cinerariifolium TaxID=118510 RepID=A0A6L2M7W6_TANCI|nr:retrovirus-related Pol polyprotein from transposon TNT 1-94 [Tanacetum cinerariifolium]